MALPKKHGAKAKYSLQQKQANMTTELMLIALMVGLGLMFFLFVLWRMYEKEDKSQA
jgi:uncharacterized protein HemX